MQKLIQQCIAKYEHKKPLYLYFGEIITEHKEGAVLIKAPYQHVPPCCKAKWFRLSLTQALEPTK